MAITVHSYDVVCLGSFVTKIVAFILKCFLD